MIAGPLFPPTPKRCYQRLDPAKVEEALAPLASYHPPHSPPQKVEEVLGDVKGVVVEDNTFSVSVHYRMVAEGEDRERVNEEVGRLVLREYHDSTDSTPSNPLYPLSSYSTTLPTLPTLYLLYTYSTY